VVEAIRDADRLVVCPSNPVTSIGPILAVQAVRAALDETRALTIAVSPIVGGAAVSGPAGDLMRASGLSVSPLGVARTYRPWLRRLVIDDADRGCAGELERIGVAPLITDVIMGDRVREVELARCVLGT
jgi:LPPG:FO 2-phospho-L-lactate transferase